MNRLLILFIFFFIVFAAAGVRAESLAFINVNVIPMTRDVVLPARTVVVTDGRIAAIGPVADTAVPDDAVLVDGTDRYLMPGLAEMHGHVTSTAAEDLEPLFGLFLANGVTTVRGMLGRPSHLTLRDDLAAGRRIGPRLITSSPSLNGNSVTSPAQADRLVRRFHADGYDFLKIHPGLTRAEFDRIAETARELGIPIAGHVPEDVGVAAALEAGIATIDHLDGYMQALIERDLDPTGGFGGFFGLLLAGIADEGRIAEVVAATRDAGTWNVPTQTLFEHSTNEVPPAEIARWPEMKYVDDRTEAQWAATKRQLLGDRGFDRRIADRAIRLRRVLIAALHQGGAGLLLGSDSPQRFNVPGFALHRELGLLVAAGLTPFEALQTGTVNPARFFGVEADRGTVEPGKVADLVLLDENPLADIENSRRVHGTMVAGHWLPRRELDRRLALAETG